MPLLFQSKLGPSPNLESSYLQIFLGRPYTPHQVNPCINTLYRLKLKPFHNQWKAPVLIPEHASQGAMQAFREIPIKIVQYQNTALQLKALRFQRLSEPLHKYPVPAQTKTFHNQWKAPVLIPEHASQGAMQAFHSNENRAGSKYCTTYLLDLWPFRQISVWLYHCGIVITAQRHFLYFIHNCMQQIPVDFILLAA
ncbi:Bacterial dynamin-like protein [Trichinella pseudospiralis]